MTARLDDSSIRRPAGKRMMRALGVPEGAEEIYRMARNKYRFSQDEAVAIAREHVAIETRRRQNEARQCAR